MLYAYPVLCVVYVLRRAGEKLPVEIVRARPTAGWLRVDQDERKTFPREAARLYRSEKDPADLLEPICVYRIRIKGGGILITGREEVRQSVTQRQAWWCLPGPLDDLTTA